MTKASAQPETNMPVASKTNEKHKKIRKKKKQKDPHAPKRALSAFILFSNELRPQLRADFPDLSITEIAKRLGTLWRETEDKTKWSHLAVQDKDRARLEKEAYVAKNEKLRNGS